MANKAKNVFYKPKPMTVKKKALIHEIIEEYDIRNAEDIQEALKDLLSGSLQVMLEAEMDEHLGYDKYERSAVPDYRNGKIPKTVRSKYGEFSIDVPQDRKSTYDPKILPKRKKDISSIDDKIISMYAKGMTISQISEKYVSCKDMKSFAKDLKNIYTAVDEKTTLSNLDKITDK